MITRIIGIDFGTSTSVVKVYNNGGGDNVYTLSVGSGLQEIPTLVFKRATDGKLFIADEALAQVNAGTDGEIFRNFKLNLISDNSQEKETAIKYTTLFLKYLHDRYVEQCNIGTFGNCDQTKVYVSYPAKWPSFVRMTMLDCAIKAGFGSSNDVFGLDEPTAAAVASLHEREDELKASGLYLENKTYKAMMVDMGAGTTDIVLFEYQIKEGNIHIDNPVTYPTAESTKLCGGREIDNILSSFCENYCQNIPASGDVPRGFLDKCKSEVKSWKEYAVSLGLKENLEIGSPGFIIQMINLMKTFGSPVNPQLRPFIINRHSFESMTQPHWTNWRNLIEEALAEGKKFGYSSADDIDIIILNGGHSQWYGVKDFFLGKPFANLEPLRFKNILDHPASLIQSIKPSHTVATGLCLRDKAVVAATPLANNLWIQFEYEGKKSAVMKICDKGHALPYKSSIQTIKDKINGNFIYRKAFDIKCVVYEGSTLNNAKRHVQAVKSPDDHFIASVLKAAYMTVMVAPFALFGIIVDFLKGDLDWNEYSDFLDADYDIKLGADVTIAEDGIATVSPYISVDNESVNMHPFNI